MKNNTIFFVSIVVIIIIAIIISNIHNNNIQCEVSITNKSVAPQYQAEYGKVQSLYNEWVYGEPTRERKLEIQAWLYHDMKMPVDAIPSIELFLRKWVAGMRLDYGCRMMDRGGDVDEYVTKVIGGKK